jgi:hypothetical protein
MPKLFFPRYLSELADDNAGGGAPKQTDLSLKGGDDGATKAQFAQLSEQMAKLKSENEKLSKADKDRKDKDAIARGEQEKLLAERTAKLEELDRKSVV